MSGFFRSILALSITALIGFTPLAHAGAPEVGTQVPGYYRLQLGRFEVTALYDGSFDLNPDLLKNITASDLNPMLSRMFVDNARMPTAVNAYLINTGDHLVLVDTGTAIMSPPSLGHMLQNMKAAGYDADQVDMVLITHMHPDHIGGLSDAAGTPLFPKAQVFVSQPESTYWLSQEVADAAPVQAQSRFKMARDIAAPYLARGQWKTFVKDTELVPGIQPVMIVGHTPGHAAFAVESDGQKLLIWGDVVHAHAVQFARPEVSMEFDTDQKQAVETRRSVLKEAAAGKYLVAGMHLPFPGIGHVRSDGEDTYSWVPVEFGLLPQIESKSKAPAGN